MKDEAELIARLLTLAGAIMEDASPVAIVDGASTLEQRITGVMMAADQAGTLVRAAEVVRRQMLADRR